MIDNLHTLTNKFIHLTPYESPMYFVLLAIALVPIVVGLLHGKKILWYQNIVTIVFLFISFGGPSFKPAYALFVFILWQLAIATGYFKHVKEKNKNWVFYTAVILAIFPLFLVKFIPFILSRHFMSGVLLTHPTLSDTTSFIGFLGISYLTFKAVQIIMEMRDGLIKEYSIKNYIQFLVFFPTISSGPIDRYRRFEKDLVNTPDPKVYEEMLVKGLHQIYMGFLYKFIIAILINKFLLEPAQTQALNHSGFSLEILGVMYAYTLYLFFDFAGYSFFAIGVSNIMGYNVPINFNKPFLSANIKEFWDRWHISLSSWFRDYVYMRLMFTLLKKKVFKSRVLASNVGYFALFLLMALWHGFTWYYIVYGLYHATLICLTDAWLRFKRKRKNKIPSNKYTHALAVFMTFNAVAFGLLLFSGFLDKLI